VRLAGQIKLGYYPTPTTVTALVRSWLRFPDGPFAALDPCAGEGIALAQTLDGTRGAGYGIELDPERARAARTRLQRVITGDYKSLRASIAAFSLLWLNPPYDDEAGEESTRGERKEHAFLRDSIHYLQPGGVLVYIVPQQRLYQDTVRLLGNRFERLRAFRFPDDTYGDFGQCVVLGIKRRHGEHDPATVEHLLEFARSGPAAPPLTARPPSEESYLLPPGTEPKLFRGGAIDPEELAADVAASPLWARAEALTGGRRARQAGRPPVLLHRGHLALLLASGEIDGPVGAGPSRHVVRGSVRKHVTVTEEEDEEGNVTRRETESLRVVIRTVDASGAIRTIE
jgi:hypothetical protein